MPNILVNLTAYLAKIDRAGPMLTDKSAGDTSDIISDSSGVGTSNSDTTTCSLQNSAATVVCLQPYEPTAPKHVRLNQGDIIEGD